MGNFCNFFKIKHWFLLDRDFSDIESQRGSEHAKHELSYFRIFILWGNLLPILIGIITTFLLYNPSKEIDRCLQYIKIINNGSLPLICYSILMSGVLFLFDKTKPNEYSELRRRLLGIFILLLFLNISIYIFLTSSNHSISFLGHFIIFGFTIYFLLNTISITKIMFLLQEKVNSYSQNFSEELRELDKEDNVNSSGIKF